MSDSARYEEIKYLRRNGVTFSKEARYACYYFKGELTNPEAQALSDSDVVLIIDEGYHNFGSEFKREGNNFWGKIYTD